MHLGHPVKPLDEDPRRLTELGDHSIDGFEVVLKRRRQCVACTIDNVLVVHVERVKLLLRVVHLADGLAQLILCNKNVLW